MTATAVRRALSVAGLVAAATAAHVWYGNRHHFFDLRIYWEAVRWWAGGHDLYGYARPDSVQGSLGFTYPPFAALVLRPLAVLPFGVAAGLFVAVSAAALTVTVYWLVSPFVAEHRVPRWYALALALPLVSWLEPIRETLTFGQINLVLALLVVGDLLVAGPRGSRWAGGGIGLATAIKLTPAIFIVYLLLTRRGRAGLTAAGTALAATLVAAAVDWHASWRFWTDTMWQTQRVGHLDRVTNQSLLAMLSRLAAPAQPSRALWVVLVVAVAGYGLWRARRAALHGDEVCGLTLAGLVGCLVSPITWTHHVFWFVPALVLLISAGHHRRAYVALALLIYGTVTVSVVAWYDWKFIPHSVDHGLPGFLIDNWYVLLMLALLAALPIRARTAAPPEPGDAQLTPSAPDPRPVIAQ